MTTEIPGLPKNLHPFALGIGALCHEWATLEEHVVASLLQLSEMPPHHVSYFILRCFNFRDQLLALKVAAIERFHHEGCLEAFLSSIDYIDNVLRVRRNGYVHDPLFGAVDGSLIKTMKMKIKITRPQAHQPRKVALGQLQELSIDDLIQTTEEIRQHAKYLSSIMHYYRNQSQSPDELLATPPKQAFRGA